MSKDDIKIGVYVCHCGVNIAGVVDVDNLVDFAKTLPNVSVARDYKFYCSDNGQQMIKDDINDGLVNRVVVAACSPRMHEPTFRRTVSEAGLNEFLFCQANIREHATWVNMRDKEGATRIAKDHIRMQVAKAAQLEPLEKQKVPVEKKCLVIGGGIAGVTAALDVANRGFEVYLVEKEKELGGHLKLLDKVFPIMETAESILKPKIEEIKKNKHIHLWTESQLDMVEGYVGNFYVNVLHENSNDIDEIKVGTIIVATGFDPYDPTEMKEYGYGRYKNIITTLEMEEMFLKGKVIRPSDQKVPQNVGFLQCVGSRNFRPGMNNYCSRVCCMNSMKLARQFKEQNPESTVYIFYMDIRAFGKGYEEFYEQSSREYGISFMRGRLAEVWEDPEDKTVVVRGEDTLTQMPLEIKLDLFVLSIGIEARKDSDKIASLLSIQKSGDGFFMEAHPKLRPVDTLTEGIFIAGVAQGPKDITDTVAQAKGAATSASILMSRGQVEIEPYFSVIHAEVCAGCKACISQCPYGAITFDEINGVSVINSAKCHGCGTCVATCPSNAITQNHFNKKQITSILDAVLNEGGLY